MFISDHNNIKASEIKEEQLVRIERCGICGCDSFRKLICFSESPQINYIICKGCGAVTFDKILNQKAIDELYTSDVQYYKDDNSKESGGSITFYGSRRFARHLLKHYSLKKDRYKILDFGGGDGELAYSVASELLDKYGCDKADITVVDYTDSLYITKNERISIKHVFPLEKLNEGDFDIIIARGIIEHIPNPGVDIRKLFDLLGARGIIYFGTPYIYPLRRDLQRFGIEYDTLYPAHIWDLGGKWYNKLPQYVGSKANISILSSRPSIVEKSFRSHFFIALASYILKSPWYICHKWPYVGGWEAVYEKL